MNFLLIGLLGASRPLSDPVFTSLLGSIPSKKSKFALDLHIEYHCFSRPSHLFYFQQPVSYGYDLHWSILRAKASLLRIWNLYQSLRWDPNLCQKLPWFYLNTIQQIVFFKVICSNHWRSNPEAKISGSSLRVHLSKRCRLFCNFLRTVYAICL